ncbi:MAG: winged helix-turn-helix transcriptional regulator [Clostridia bacterium]|nr:winged helix-turn-helix transcriptional regulator [Clostridia bacterium]
MENDNKVFEKALVDLNLALSHRLEGIDFISGHRRTNIDIEFKILHLLETYGRLTPAELMQKLYVAKSNLSNQCKVMMQKSLIKQYGDKQDRRVVCYGICALGREKYQNTLKEVVRNFENIVAEYDWDEAKKLVVKLISLFE